MNNIHSRIPENVPGPFYVTKACISCSACWEIAPRFIKTHPIHTYAYFFKQPRNKNELKTCMKALEICPVPCIYRSEDN